MRRLFLLVPLVPFLAAGALYLRVSNPRPDPQPIPEGQISVETAEGRALLATATAQADHAALRAALQPQEKLSWCGVASAATVLSAARNERLDQDAFFTPAASAVRSWWRVTAAGMPLADLGGMLAAHGFEVEVHHADPGGLPAFRSAAARNLARPGDWLIVNYSRAALQQGDSGHISPVSAYDAASDRFLVLDVATYKFPPIWVPAEALFAAMATVDSESGRARGWVEVREGR